MATLIAKIWQPWKVKFRLIGFQASWAIIYGQISFSGLPSVSRFLKQLTYGIPENKNYFKISKTCQNYHWQPNFCHRSLRNRVHFSLCDTLMTYIPHWKVISVSWRPVTKFWLPVIVLVYFLYFQLIFIFRGPIYGLF